MNWFRSLLRRKSETHAERRRPVLSEPQSVRFRPAVEALEARRLMAAGDFITEMSDLADEFPTKTTATILYLNFDGRTPSGERSTAEQVSPFQSDYREQDIQDILFRTSEIFAPFNVQVVRMHGDGNYDGSSNGNTTIFIGDHPAYTKTVNGVTVNGTGGYAPAVYTDYPCDNRPGSFELHQLNSDPFDLAYVDPRSVDPSLGVGKWDNLTIAQAIAHEAGHTFGLAHVLSKPAQDVMSYDAANAAFLNQSFNITNLNNDPEKGVVPTPALVPTWYSTNTFGNSLRNNLLTQNSFATLTTLLGPRVTSGDVANVANRGAVDPGFLDASMPTLNVAQSRTSSINRLGDYDVFSFTPTSSGTVRVEVEKVDGGFFTPVVMVYRPDLVLASWRALDSDQDGVAEVEFYASAGVPYRLVAGGLDSRSTGTYRISLDRGWAGGLNPLLGIQDRAGSQNGLSDQVELENSGGHFKLSVNGTLIYSDRTEDIQSVTVEGTGDYETFSVIGSMPFTTRLRGGAGDDRITASGGTNTWVVDTTNGGTLNSNVTFSSIANITGGSGADTFQIRTYGWLDGRISGGGGTDTLDYSSRSSGANTLQIQTSSQFDGRIVGGTDASLSSVTVNLGTGTATGIDDGIASIENVIGSPGADRLIGSSGVNVLRGGGGDDTLLGGGGDDYLFGDAGRDYLDGQGDNDYLEGGFDGLKDTLIGGSGYDRFVYYNYRPYSHLPNYWLPEMEDTDFKAGEDAWVPLYVG